MNHCGQCGKFCPGASCEVGVCVASCEIEGYADCDGNLANGCETRLGTLTDCGECGVTCEYANVWASCETGACESIECKSVYADCDGNADTGCETPLNTLTDCGACGVACDEVSCAGGVCTALSCGVGLADCLGDGGSCETSLSTLENCEMCGRECALDNAVATCWTGSCEIDYCNEGYADCDGQLGNGCEVRPPESNCSVGCFGGHGYYACTNTGSWTDANSHCTSVGMYLARVDDAAENTFILNKISGDSWLGANDRTTEGQWVWSNNGDQFWSGGSGGSSVGGRYSHWNSGEPNDDGGEDCGEMYKSSNAGYWNDTDCGDSLRYVCEG